VSSVTSFCPGSMPTASLHSRRLDWRCILGRD
jgi:hypothetical protein